MATTRYFFGASHEHFPPEALLRQAVAAERAGFDGISASDHLRPALIAQAWATLERLLPGRVYLGIGSPAHHVQRLRELEALGATVIVLQNNSGADPLRALGVYGESVLPELRGARV